MTITQIEAMGLTLVIEGVTAAALAPLFRLDRASCILSAMLASTLTHPILWAVFYPSQALFGTLTTPVLEIFRNSRRSDAPSVGAAAEPKPMVEADSWPMSWSRRGVGLLAPPDPWRAVLCVVKCRGQLAGAVQTMIRMVLLGDGSGTDRPPRRRRCGRSRSPSR